MKFSPRLFSRSTAGCLAFLLAGLLLGGCASTNSSNQVYERPVSTIPWEERVVLDGGIQTSVPGWDEDDYMYDGAFCPEVGI